MKKLAIALVAAAFLAPAAGAQTKIASGDTCTYNGSGTTYTVNIVSGPGVQQYGFAVSAPGVTIGNISVPGRNGNFGTSSTPPGSNGNWGGWTSDEALTGSIVATVTVSGTPTGKFTILPEGQNSATFDEVTCSLHLNPAKPTIDIKVSKVKYVATAHGWHLMIKVPVAGTLSAVQPLATNITPIKQLKAKALVQTHSIGTKTGGMLTLTLRPTSSGSTVLATKSVIKVKLRVTFNAMDGRTAQKTVSIALRR
ncbi:MAG TPA: hypothetical protein VGL76_05530 [Gaiellaceae bacterium]|jgi:hypothetical protein